MLVVPGLVSFSFRQLSWPFVPPIIYHLCAIVFAFFFIELGLNFYALMIFSLIYCIPRVSRVRGH